MDFIYSYAKKKEKKKKKDWLQPLTLSSPIFPFFTSSFSSFLIKWLDHLKANNNLLETLLTKIQIWVEENRLWGYKVFLHNSLSNLNWLAINPLLLTRVVQCQEQETNKYFENNKSDRQQRFPQWLPLVHCRERKRTNFFLRKMKQI